MKLGFVWPMSILLSSTLACSNTHVNFALASNKHQVTIIMSVLRESQPQTTLCFSSPIMRCGSMSRDELEGNRSRTTMTNTWPSNNTLQRIIKYFQHTRPPVKTFARHEKSSCNSSNDSENVLAQPARFFSIALLVPATGKDNTYAQLKRKSDRSMITSTHAEQCLK